MITGAEQTPQSAVWHRHRQQGPRKPQVSSFMPSSWPCSMEEHDRGAPDASMHTTVATACPGRGWIWLWLLKMSQPESGGLTAAHGVQLAKSMPQHKDVCSATATGTRWGWRQEQGEGFRSHHRLHILPLSTDPRGLSAALTVFEGQELKDAVHDGDDDGQRQQVGIRLQESNLEQASKTSLRLLLPNAPGIGRIQEDPAGHGHRGG